MAAEGRFYGEGDAGPDRVDETLFFGWAMCCPDIARLEDRAQIQGIQGGSHGRAGAPEKYRIQRRLRGDGCAVWHADLQDHIIACLTEEATLSGRLYFTGSDVFLRTVADWYFKTATAPSRTRMPDGLQPHLGRGVRGAQQRRVVEIQNCYEVLEAICLHWRARLYFSDGCYRF